ncbi:MAG: hypothetical protein AMS23_01930 [Bacteroides sp. SM1_62]|nr:MAG: hypothetical protein AMS23_01930 [Bacteroides sp. SM1_62]
MIFLGFIFEYFMPELPEPDLKLLPGSIAIVITILAFLVFYFMAISSRLGMRLHLRFSPEAASVRSILLQRLTGTVLYGFVPVLVVVLVFRMPISHFGWNSENLARTLTWWIPIALLVVAVTYFAARNGISLASYPQIRVRQWDPGLILLSALSWTVYLAGYESVFRGFLLFSCHESFGFWPAVIINISIYSLVHLPKGYRETLGSVFLGFILAYTTLRLGSFWFAFLVHLTLALSNEWFSIAFHPDMTLVRNQTSR